MRESRDRSRSTRSGQLYYDRLSEANAIPLRLLKKRPGPPRGLVYRDGILQWEQPNDERNINFYNVYLDSDASTPIRMPAGQTKLDVLDRVNPVPRRAWVSAVNERSGLESKMAYTDIRILPPAPAPPAGGGVAGDPGTVAYVPAAGPYGTMGFKDFSLTGKADMLQVAMWYVDEPETQYLYGILTGAMNAGDLTPTINVNVANRAKELNGTPPVFANGDLILIDDPDQDPSNPPASPGTARKYEIATIGTVAGSQPGEVTFALSARSVLGSYRSAHAISVRIYKVKAAHFTVPTKDNAGNSKLINEENLPLASACVAAMAVAAEDVGVLGTWNLKNCSELAYPFPGGLTQRNPAPGFRTCTGSSYTIPLGGTLIAGQTSPHRLVVAENTFPRCMAAKVLVAPTGIISFYDGVLYGENDKALVFYVLLIEPQREGVPNGERRVAVADQISVANGDFATFSSGDVPDFRRMPYRIKWPFSCPVVGTIDSLFDSSLGELRTGVLPFNSTGESIQWEQDSEVDSVVARAGSTVPGSHATVTVLN